MTNDAFKQHLKQKRLDSAWVCQIWSTGFKYVQINNSNIIFCLFLYRDQLTQSFRFAPLFLLCVALLPSSYAGKKQILYVKILKPSVSLKAIILYSITVIFKRD